MRRRGLLSRGAVLCAVVGTWMSADPIGIEDGTNVYGYCQGNPVMLVDLAGTDSSTPIKDADITNLPPNPKL